MARNRLPKGKGWYIWVLKNTLNGEPEALAKAAKNAGIGHLVFHIHDGYLGETKVLGGMDLTNHIKEANDEGIECWGWGAVYRSTWSQGCDRVIEAFRKYPGLVGYLLDAEAPIKGSYQEATLIMNKLRKALPDTPIGLSSYRYPKYHLDLPWKEFRSQVDFDIPQVYWEQSTGDNAGAIQLDLSYKEFKAMTPKLPYVATGPAYKAGGWAVTPKQIQGFMDMAKTLGIPAVDFWVWYQAQANLPDVFNHIQSSIFGDGVIIPPPIVLTWEQKVDKLWQAHPELNK